jgi:pilus assembly protein CpaB
MKMNNRFIYGILSIVLAAVIAFIAIPAVTSRTSSTCEIVRIKTAVSRGSIITADDIETVEVGGFNLPDTVARRIEDVAGTYASCNLYPGDYILPEKVSTTPLSSDLTLNDIPDGMVAISITTQTLATALSDKLQSGDIIRLYHYDDNNVVEPVSDIPELRFVKVLSVTDSKGLDIDYTTPPAEDEEKQQTATITVLATPEQAMLLTKYENEGVIHVALISRGNDKLATELLERQNEILDSLYGNDIDIADEFFAPSMGTVHENGTDTETPDYIIE